MTTVTCFVANVVGTLWQVRTIVMTTVILIVTGFPATARGRMSLRNYATQSRRHGSP